MSKLYNEKVSLTQTYGDYGIRFAGPDLIDYEMIFEISGGDYDGKRIRIGSSYHVCCGTSEVEASLFGAYKRWRNKLDGCKQHQREEGGERELRDIVWNVSLMSKNHRIL